MNENYKKIGRGMSIRMALLMSFFLSLVGTLTSGHFTVVGFLLSFVVSTIISLLIGLIVPMGKVTEGACRKVGLKPRTIGNRLLSSLISDLIYTPLMTFCMVFMAYKMAMIQSHGMAQLNFLKMFLPSLAITFVVGYVLIFIFTPIFMGQLMKKYGAPTER